MPDIDKLFRPLIKLGGSDLHMIEGQPPKIRLHGKIQALKHPVLDRAMMERYLGEICPADRWDHYLKNHDLDFASFMEDAGDGLSARFRTNYYFQQHGMAAVFRQIPSKIATLKDLNLPDTLKKFAELRSGLVLCTGPTGSGKSTTLAALIDYINDTYARKIITIEEPIEFVHGNKKCTICQREVGIDVHSFADGLKASTRQDADVVLVGEMRDLETIGLAVTAAAMGMLVFGTLHTNSAVKTVDRIIDVFPAEQQDQIRTMLADALKGVVAQLLLKKKGGGGRIAVNEILIGSTGLSATIRENNIPNIRNIIQAGGREGMVLMDDAIARLLKQGVIDGEEAYAKATDKNRFEAHAPR
ncbi:MAG: type IV pilus twitching motility protein PilT [Planctomycetota bacterium]